MKKILLENALTENIKKELFKEKKPFLLNFDNFH